ncbi:hypothetical protein B0T22DRAFT_478402 [Podospora appendiculata]|uniref:Uncharacterized protein n=1 Tax=Podospora appendiculata TaxID=314037 RepID=A0AAE0XLP7_9PEZI|nr:hypothetical protein B0T22DRAFT_478402 [Podospora appendiculata]
MNIIRTLREKLKLRAAVYVFVAVVACCSLAIGLSIFGAAKAREKNLQSLGPAISTSGSTQPMILTTAPGWDIQTTISRTATPVAPPTLASAIPEPTATAKGVPTTLVVTTPPKTLTVVFSNGLPNPTETPEMISLLPQLPPPPPSPSLSTSRAPPPPVIPTPFKSTTITIIPRPSPSPSPDTVTTAVTTWTTYTGYGHGGNPELRNLLDPAADLAAAHTAATSMAPSKTSASPPTRTWCEVWKGWAQFVLGCPG